MNIRECFCQLQSWKYFFSPVLRKLKHFIPLLNENSADIISLNSLKAMGISGRIRVDAEVYTVQLVLDIVYEEVPPKLVGVSRVAKPHHSDNAVTPGVK